MGWPDVFFWRLSLGDLQGSQNQVEYGKHQKPKSWYQIDEILWSKHPGKRCSTDLFLQLIAVGFRGKVDKKVSATPWNLTFSFWCFRCFGFAAWVSHVCRINQSGLCESALWTCEHVVAWSQIILFQCNMEKLYVTVTLTFLWQALRGPDGFAC